jgi:hypothetical protein
MTSTLFVQADITILPSEEPDFTRVFCVEKPVDGRVDELWLFRLAHRIADRYTDAGAVCVSNVQVVTPQATDTPIAIAA